MKDPKQQLLNEAQEDEESQSQQEERQSEQIYHSGSVTPEGGRHKIHCLTIIGQVEGHYILPPQNKTTKYEHVIPQLVAIEQDDSIKGLLMILNTVGGDVEAGLAIAELVSGMKTPTVSLVLGGGHSIGVPLAVSARYSFIAPTATMTVHPVRMNGVLLGVPQTLSYFDKMQERITGFVCQNSGIQPERFKELMMNSGELVMDIGTVLDGEMAVEEGLIDSLGGLHEAVEKLYELIEAQGGGPGGPPQGGSPQARPGRQGCGPPQKGTGAGKEARPLPGASPEEAERGCRAAGPPPGSPSPHRQRRGAPSQAPPRPSQEGGIAGAHPLHPPPGGLPPPGPDAGAGLQALPLRLCGLPAPAGRAAPGQPHHLHRPRRLPGPGLHPRGDSAADPPKLTKPPLGGTYCAPNGYFACCGSW